MRAAVYVRVSTADQNADLQVRELQEYAERHGWEIAEVYRDVISGEVQSPGSQSADGRRNDVEVRLPPCLETGPLRAFPCGLLEEHRRTGGKRHPVHRRYPEPGYRCQEPRLSAPAPCARCGC